MSDQFNYKLVTPEKIYLEGDAQMVVLPGAEGDLGVLPNHSNIITSLRPGIIKVTNSDQTQSLFVEEGFIKFSNNELLVIACLLYTSPSPRDKRQSRMPSSA